MATNNAPQKQLGMPLQITYISAETLPKVLTRYKNKSKTYQLHSAVMYANDQICIFIKLTNTLENRKKIKGVPTKILTTQLRIILDNHSWYQIMPKHCTFTKLSILQIF